MAAAGVDEGDPLRKWMIHEILPSPCPGWTGATYPELHELTPEVFTQTKLGDIEMTEKDYVLDTTVLTQDQLTAIPASFDTGERSCDKPMFARLATEVSAFFVIASPPMKVY